MNLKQLLFSFLFAWVTLVSAQQKTTLYLIGDSTMADKKNPEVNPEHGWGQMLPGLVSDSLTISNHAVNGRSSKSFITEGRWQVVLDSLKTGDYLFVQFGHNDEKILDSTRYTFPFTQYRYNLERFVNESRAKGAIPVLLSSIVRRNFNDAGVLVDTHGDYPLVARMTAKDLNVPFIDLQFLTERLEKGYGVEDSKQLHLHFAAGENTYYKTEKHDDTHLSKLGATLVATLALQEVALQDLALKTYIKDSVLSKEIVSLKD
ncbi:rhamnogalacturonan acetylesterase [Leeuwenhoekiella sp. MAR_2009_132]|uniref:rhamnogalacturonan acetylesterase n=1 Tax=Leeuwenhoekiella sp. MAR_2009_132 TaxID=1392489 RepID=UPI000689A071|nr:rhamnogalacturonan acetylesterase [Leeuwenhoekiella sp. MAR_2009_132]